MQHHHVSSISHGNDEDLISWSFDFSFDNVAVGSPREGVLWKGLGSRKRLGRVQESRYPRCIAIFFSSPHPPSSNKMFIAIGVCKRHVSIDFSLWLSESILEYGLYKSWHDATFTRKSHRHCTFNDCWCSFHHTVFEVMIEIKHTRFGSFLLQK